MANVLYIIGNGFDLNLGFETGAKKFVENYKKNVLNKKSVKNLSEEGYSILINSLMADSDAWGYYEKKLGEFSANLEKLDTAEEDFLAIREDMYSCFNSYIHQSEDSLANIDLSASSIQRFSNWASTLLRYGLLPNEKSILSKHLSDEQTITFNIVTFNYTTIIDKIIYAIQSSSPDRRILYPVNGKSYNRYYNFPIHIHGTLEDDYGFILGVDNESQILGDKCRNSSQVKNLLIKPNLCLLNGCERELQAAELIRKADAICVYGASFGETDKTWWNLLGEYLKNGEPNHFIVISCLMNKEFYEGQNYLPETHYMAKSKHKKRFYSALGLDNKEAKSFDDRVFVSICYPDDKIIK